MRAHVGRLRAKLHGFARVCCAVMWQVSCKPVHFRARPWAGGGTGEASHEIARVCTCLVCRDVAAHRVHGGLPHAGWFGLSVLWPTTPTARSNADITAKQNTCKPVRCRAKPPLVPPSAQKAPTRARTGHVVPSGRPTVLMVFQFRKGVAVTTCPQPTPMNWAHNAQPAINGNDDFYQLNSTNVSRHPQRLPG